MNLSRMINQARILSGNGPKYSAWEKAFFMLIGFGFGIVIILLISLWIINDV